MRQPITPFASLLFCVRHSALPSDRPFSSEVPPSRSPPRKPRLSRSGDPSHSPGPKQLRYLRWFHWGPSGSSRHRLERPRAASSTVAFSIPGRHPLPPTGGQRMRGRRPPRRPSWRLRACGKSGSLTRTRFVRGQ